MLFTAALLLAATVSALPTNIDSSGNAHRKFSGIGSRVGNSRSVQTPVGSGPSCSVSAPTPGAQEGYWYANIEHNGESPFISNGGSWKVFRNVVTGYGADNSGNSDAQSAIQNAINDGSRNTNSYGTTGQPAVVYIPPGTYELDSPLQLYVGTVLLGDPTNPPTLKASSSFNGNTLIYAKDPSYGSTINFYIGVKNLVLDSTNVNKDSQFLILDWSVSQATQLNNVVFNMPDYSTGHTGVSTPEGGSATMMGDLTFNGGAVGLNLGTQQYEAKTMTFNGCTTGIQVSGCFDCVFVNCAFNYNAKGIDMTASSSSIGSVVLIDSTASNTGTIVSTNSESSGTHTLVLENVVAGQDVSAVVKASGNAILTSSVTDTWVYGNAYSQQTPGGQHQTGTTYNTPRSSSLLVNGKYATIAPPTYADQTVDQFVNVKSVEGYPVQGDGTTDDTASLQAIITAYAGCKIMFFPQGTYLVSDTLVFPTGSQVVGEAWSVISATGNSFSDASNPKALIQVGNAGDVGTAQFSDMLFTVADILPGCILLEVNMAGSAPGDVGFWNTHLRVGGAKGSTVETNCGGSPADCQAAFLMVHLTASSSAYIENMWGWTADHDLDGNNGQNIATGRGMFVEATAATWLQGTAFEHNTLYQYSIQGANNVFAAMQQSETPYWQGGSSAIAAPAPWTPSSTYGDPSYASCSNSNDPKCGMAFFETINNSQNLFLYGAGFWTFFNDYDGSCQSSDSGCQTNAIDLSGGGISGLYWYGVNTHTNINVIVGGNDNALVTQNNNPGGWGACVGAFLLDS